MTDSSCRSDSTMVLLLGLLLLLPLAPPAAVLRLLVGCVSVLLLLAPA